MFESLDAVRGDAWERLSLAASDRKSAMHTPVVATADVDTRVMVLRAFDPDTGTLRFHTDARAPKVEVIERDPRLAVLFYDKAAKVQIRVKGEGRILRDGTITENAWGKSDNFARRCYLGDGPGTFSDRPSSGLPEQFEGVEPNDEEVAVGRGNFAVLLVEIHHVDWFYLAHTGHIRAQFDKSGSNWIGRWVTP